MQNINNLVNNYSNTELLNAAIKSGMLSVSDIQSYITMNERKRYLDSHTHKIWSKENKYYTYLPDEHSARGMKLLKRTSLRALEDSIIAYYKEQEKSPHFNNIFNSWIEEKIKYGEIQKQTKDRYVADYERFIAGTNIEKIKFKSITEEILEDFIKSTIHTKKLTSKAWSGLRTIINGCFKYGKKHGHTLISITQFMGDMELSSKIFEKKIKLDDEYVFTDEELKLIENKIMLEDKSLLNRGVLLIFQTNLRTGELSALKWSDIHDDYINISKTEVRYKDNGKYVFEVRDFPKTEAGVRKVILTDKAKAILNDIRTLNPDSDYIFVKNGKRIRGKLFTSKLYRICDKLNIKRRSAHKARMTYATKLIDAGVPTKLITQQMGHKNISTTLGHYYYNNKTLETSKGLIYDALDN